jgi:tetratricopeptide (TPR) repeat protein
VHVKALRALVVASVLLAAGVEAAPKKPPAPHDQKQEKAARAHFERAEKAFNLGKFDEALTGYQEAYEALPLPAFLFNIAQCHRNLRNREQAVFFYQRYLSLAPDAPNRPVVEELIAEQKRQLETQPTPEPEDKPVNLQARPEAPPSAVAKLDAPADQPKSRWEKSRWWLVGALGAVLIGGVALLAVRSGGSPPQGSLGAIDTR